MCDCIAIVNAKLAERNTMLNFNMLNDRDIIIDTIKADPSKRGKPVAMFASHCPFCGEKIDRSAGAIL